MEKPRLLVIDDDEPIRTQMRWALVQDYDVALAPDGDAAMEFIKTGRPSVVTLDLGLPPHPEGTSEGLKLLGQILAADPSIKVIVVTGNPDKGAALNAIAQGAYDFFTKPIDVNELKPILKRAYHVHTLEAEYRELQRKVKHKSFAEMVGTSRAMNEIFDRVRKVSTTDVPVLVTGESGTGKELVARAIHTGSLRQSGPFVPINCGAIPENLLESELFGHEKGAFTGAHIQRCGKIELARNGTLFLDEIAELPLQLQVKMLRFLQDYRFERVGGRETMEIDVRVLAATNRDLRKLVAEGRFREDLYYRLAVVTIDLPPLRDRGEDMALLARAFVEKFSSNGKVKTLSGAAVDAICSYQWPGNIRELENRVRRALTFTDGNVITPDALGLDAPGEPMSLGLKEAREEVEIRLIRKAMSKNNGNITRAAEDLGLTRPTLHHLIKKYNITTNQI